MGSSGTSPAHRKLRVTFLCLEWPGDAPTGGVGRYAFRLATELSDMVQLTVITQAGGSAVPGAEMIYIPAARGRFERYYLTPVKAARQVRPSHPDVVHSFGDDWALPPGPWRRVRHYLGLSWSEARSSTGLRKWNHFLLAGLEKYTQYLADYRIGIGPESTAAFRCHLTMPPLARIPLPHGGLPTENPSVVFIGSFSGRKRGYLAQQVVESATARLGTDVTLTVIGPPADAKNWGPNVRHVAGASDDEVERIIAESWLLLAPSSYEGFGIPTFEALALGVRSIATPTPGSQYLQSFFGSPSALGIVGDSELADVVATTLSLGPHLSATETANTRAGVQAVSEAASAKVLIQGAYAAEA